ncbi:hypothetical protein COP2_033465 [Malus domestica]
MAFSFSLKCYPWSPTHTIHQTPSPPPASAQKTFTSLSFQLSHRHDQLLTHSSLSYSTPTTTYHHPSLRTSLRSSSSTPFAAKMMSHRCSAFSAGPPSRPISPPTPLCTRRSSASLEGWGLSSR